MSNDHKKRLASRLEWEGFIETKIKSDGNCQFSSLADQLFRCPEHHEKVRERIVKQLKTCPKIYREFVEMDSSKKRTNELPKDYSEYVKNMSKNGVWGDSVTLQAAADTFGVKIVVITSEKEVDSMEIVPKSLTLERVVYLSYLAGVHYNSIYLKGSETDAAPLELPGKSKNKNTNKSDMEPQGRNENDKDKNKEKMKKNKDRNQRKNK
ncbi:Cysteine proteinases superfamily protein [Raphanus sativus]|uniref:OVARIAN TUMOR DOMAIN-containing deubiquitinating enzyme 9 n=1 Tax=Raphanus sativus TaxID=3726 RepID=A0A6J0MWA4_RAPSA|nr:OVARIAN TUMOR DOMAIN-containing deubiquitinating enzyme 9 [Raphanus sativus]KAJ4908517.1 Cysteine proteinases superfamily protein [Raphanus sativus]